MRIGFFTNASQEERFWAWFTKHMDKFFHELDSNRGVVFDELGKQLKKINPDLTYEFSPILESGKREFIISADGIRSAFPNVIRLVDAAPRYNMWEIIAFRQRSVGKLVVNFKDFSLGFDDIFFTHEVGGNRVSVQLFIKDYFDNEPFAQATYLLLDALLGEYDVETKLGYIELKRLKEEPTGTKLLPFKDLQQIVDTLGTAM